MTREGAIIILGNIPIDDDECYSIPQYQQAKTMAIEALEQLTSYERTINKLTKAISEQEPFNIETYCKEHFCVMVDKDVWEKAKKALEQELCKDMEEIREVMSCDADAETKCKMISNILTTKPHYFEKQMQEPTTHGYMLVCQNCGLDVHSDFESCPRCGEKMKVGE